MKDDRYEDTPPARKLQKAAFSAMMDAEDYDRDWIYGAIDAIEINKETDGITPRQKLDILCSAIFARMDARIGNPVAIEDVHPFCQPAIDLADAVSALTMQAIIDAEESADLEDGTLDCPDWT